MELIKEHWHEEDRKSFLDYLHTLERKDKEAWSRRILNTQLELLCIPTKTLYTIANQIYQGNYQSFLELKIFNNYEAIVIYGKLISQMKDFDEMHHYLKQYVPVMENWAHVDLLSFQIHEKNRLNYLDLSDCYLKREGVWENRLGLMILFQMVNDKRVLPVIFDALSSLKDEKEYYVIMMAGWLLCECIIKHRDETLLFIEKTPKLNVKVLNKGIQKCRESRRFTQLEKDELLKYKR